MPPKATHKKSSAAKNAKAKSNSAERTITKAAENVQSNADRARDLSAALIRAGELLGQGATFMESIADRATTTAARKRSRKKT